ETLEILMGQQHNTSVILFKGLRHAAQICLSSDSRQALRFLLDLLRPHRWLIVVGLLAVIATSMCEGGTVALLPVAAGVLMNQQAGGWMGQVASWVEWLAHRPLDRQELFCCLLAGAIVLLLVRSGGLILSGIIGAHLRTFVEAGLRRTLFRHIVGMNFAS